MTARIGGAALGLLRVLGGAARAGEIPVTDVFSMD
jgi:hypothetical protein